MQNQVVTKKTDFAGRDGFIWWVGEVEDNKDPAQLGRVRVRIAGWYTGHSKKEDYTTEIPTEDLPWAQVMLPTDKAQTKNSGSTTELQPGAWVIGFFMDGEDAQLPCVMGAIRSFKQSSDPNAANAGDGMQKDVKKTTLADGTVAEEQATSTPQQKDAAGRESQGGNSFAKVPETPGNAQGSNVDEAKQAGINPLVASTPGGPMNPMKPPTEPQGIANGVAGPGGTGFETDISRMLTEVGNMAASVATDPVGGLYSMITGKPVNEDVIYRGIGNIMGYISRGISGILAPLKDFIAKVTSEAMQLLMKAISSFIPMGSLLSILSALQQIADLFCLPFAPFLSAVQGALSSVNGFMSTVSNLITTALNNAIGQVTSAVAEVTDGILSKIKDTLDEVKNIASTIVSAINTAKGLVGGVSQVANSLFAIDFANLNWGSILNILMALLSFLKKDCGKKVKQPKSTFWMPLVGTSECSSVSDFVATGNIPSNYNDALTRGKGTSTSSDGNFIDQMFQNLNPYLMDVKTELNGTQVINDATPGKEKRINSGPGGVSTFEDKKGNIHKTTPGSDTRIIAKDECTTVKGNKTLTVEGDFYLKVMGDWHIEVAGSKNENTANGPDIEAGTGVPQASSYDNGQAVFGSANSNTSAAERLKTGLAGAGNAKAEETESKSVQTIAGDHEVAYRGNYHIQAAKVKFTAISDIILNAQTIKSECSTMENQVDGEIINEANYITSFINLGRYEFIALFPFPTSPNLTGSFTYAKGSHTIITSDQPGISITPPSIIRIASGVTFPATISDVIIGSTTGNHFTFVASPTGGIAEVVTGATGAIVNQVTTGVIAHGVTTGFAAFGCAVGPTQIYGLPVLLN